MERQCVLLAPLRSNIPSPSPPILLPLLDSDDCDTEGDVGLSDEDDLGLSDEDDQDGDHCPQLLLRLHTDSSCLKHFLW